MAKRPGIEILDHCETPLGLLCLRRRAVLSRPGIVVTEVTLAGEFLMSSHHTESERALARRGLAWHEGTDLDVMVGGLGLGYTAHAALASSRVARLEVVEFLPQVIAWLERGLVPLAPELQNDARLEVVEGDVYRRLREPPERIHDVILVDVDHNPDEALHDDNLTFYTVDGLRAAREHLAPGGVLAVWSTDESPAFQRALEEVFPEVRVETVGWWNDFTDEEQRDDVFMARRER